jgi:hypothetical protein
MTRLVSAALALTATALAGVVVWELSAKPRRDNVAQRPRPVATVAPAPRAAAPDNRTAWIATILSRPLFSPDRRPPAVPSSAADAPAAAAGVPRLAGIIISAERRAAIFVAPGETHSVTATEGASIGHFTVRSIDPAGVVISGAEGVRVLRPSYDGNAAKAPPVVAASTGSLVAAGRPGDLTPRGSDSD